MKTYRTSLISSVSLLLFCLLFLAREARPVSFEAAVNYTAKEEDTMKNVIKIGLGAVVAVALCLVVFFAFQADASAKSVTALEVTNFDVSIFLKDNLKLYVGKDVFVHLRSGKTIQGYVKSVGNDFVHIEKLAGRDFYDALVRIEEISAIEVKFRDMK